MYSCDDADCRCHYCSNLLLFFNNYLHDISIIPQIAVVISYSVVNIGLYVSWPAAVRRDAGYVTETYSSVLPVSSDSDGATYKCTVNFSLSDETTSSVAVDRRSPAFNFTWISAPPLNVHCKHIALAVYWVVVDHMRILFF